MLSLVGALAPLLAMACGSATHAHEDPPVAVFRELEGTWQGDFVGYDTTGQELYRLEVKQTYRTVDAETQSVIIEDTLADGSVVRGTGANYARKLASGEIELSCDVLKSNGDRVRHRARLIRGPRGAKEFIWYSSDGGRSETFRETVVEEGDSWIYQIDGMGRYGENLILMAGRYRKVSG